ncbi:unnamed protein product, partial [Nesidiocoris tenuis]
MPHLLQSDRLPAVVGSDAVQAGPVVGPAWRRYHAIPPIHFDFSVHLSSQIGIREFSDDFE